MRILGVDPGTVVAGWGVIEDQAGRPRHLAHGVIRLSGARAERLLSLHRELGVVLARFSPAVVALEKSFVGDNVQTAFRLGEARGAVMVAAAAARLAVLEYSPAEVKVAVAGSGRAGKWQMQRMIGRLLGIEDDVPADAADALAVALCHAQLGHMKALIGISSAARRGSGASARRAWEALAMDRAAAAPEVRRRSSSTRRNRGER